MGAGFGSVRLPDDERLRNHVASQHAAGLFAAGEAASGAAAMGALAEIVAQVTPLATGAEIKYSTIARGPIVARAQVSEDAADIRRRIDADGKASFDVNVSFTDESAVEVATMTVRWRVAKRA
jgi:acyl-coenzyme A thioesterase PaaI-like protein